MGKVWQRMAGDTPARAVVTVQTGYVYAWRLLSRPDFIRTVRVTFGTVDAFSLACDCRADSVTREQVKAAVTVGREWLARSSGSHHTSMTRLILPLIDAWETYQTLKQATR